MALIEIKNLTKSFGRQKVLDDISLDVEKGQSVVIIGQSGTGKSVLIKHLMRLMQPDSGQVIFDGQDLAELTDDRLVKTRRRFGMLFQSAALFDSLTVEENVGLGLKESLRYDTDKVHEICAEKLKMVGLTDAAEKSPAQLSGGMRKRVGLARAIATDPEVLLYDEPTTGLDPITSDMINNMIVELNEKLNVTSIIVTHDMRSAYKVGDRIVMLHNQEIQFDGTPDEIQDTDNALVQQFIKGEAEGPIKV